MPEIDPDLGPVFAAMRATRGKCPQSERLAQLVAGGLDAADVLALEEHVAMCGRCDALVTRMRACNATLRVARKWAFVRSPAFAWAAAVVMTVGVAVYYRPAPSGPPVGAPPFQSAEFVPLRERQRGADDTPKVAGTQPRVVLALAIPAQPGYRYAVRIVPGPDRAEPLTISAATGAAYVTINRRDFKPGRYACVVSESDSVGRDTGRVFEFPFSF